MNDPLKKYRRRFRAWKNTIRLKRELNYYNSRFESRCLTVPEDQTILETINSKFSGLTGKPRRSLNILTIYHHYNWENDSLKPSLETFGTMRHYDWFERFNHQRKDWLKSIRSKMNNDLLLRRKDV